MNTLTSSIFKSFSLALGLHVLFIVLGSWAFYNNTGETLELYGNLGTEKRLISFTDMNFSSKKFKHTSIAKIAPRGEQNIRISKNTKITTTSTRLTSETAESTEANTEQNTVGSGDDRGSDNATRTGESDFDHGYLFGQIKNFFESRLGSTLNIRENQLIKIKVTLNKEGEIVDATLVQGKLDMSILRRVMSVAKNIPLNKYWKSTTYPQELIIPLMLTPS